MAEVEKQKGFSLGKPDANVTTKSDNADETARSLPRVQESEDQGKGTDASRPAGEKAGIQIPESDLDAELGAQAAVNHGGHAVADGEVLYSSHPIRNYKIGNYEFVNTLLRLTDKDEIAKFEAMYEKLPQSEKLIIKKLDSSRVDAIVESRRMATKQFDSSLGREALSRLQADNPTVGMQDIAHEKRPQQDNNVPVIPKEPVDPEGKTGLDQGAHVVEESGTDSAV